MFFKRLFEKISKRKRVYSLICDGVSIIEPSSIDIRGTIVCGSEVHIDKNVIIKGDVRLADGVRIGANCIINNSTVGKGTLIHPFSLIEGVDIGEESSIGPYGRVRPKTTLGDHVQIGNFVEIKNATVGSGCRINHISFVGDAVLSEKVTIGAGTITCNYDGVKINQTNIQEGAFIGSGCNIVAPINIGTNSVVGAGSTITKDVPKGKLTIARTPQTCIEKWKGLKA